MEPTFESIQPIIIHEQWTGNNVALRFKAANQDQPIDSMGMAMLSQDEMMKRIAAETAKSTASSMAVNTGARALGNLTGISGAGSAIGSAASNAGVGYQMDMEKIMRVEITEAVRQEVILNAFKTLAVYYKFANGEWLFVPPVH